MITPEVGSLILGAVQIVFSLALVPAVRDRSTVVPRSTSIPTGLGLTVMALTFAGMALWVAAATAAWCAALWAFLALFRAPRPLLISDEALRRQKTQSTHPGTYHSGGLL